MIANPTNALTGIDRAIPINATCPPEQKSDSSKKHETEQESAQQEEIPKC